MAESLTKKILIVTQHFWPENFRINDITDHLCEQGYNLTVLTGLPNYPDGKTYKSYKENPNKFSCYNGVKVIRVPILPRGSSKFTLMLNYLSFIFSASLFGLWKLRDYNFDRIFVFGVSPPTVAIPAILLGKIKSVKVTFWVLDIWPETLEAVNILSNRICLNFIGGIVRKIYKHCDKVLFTCEEAKLLVQERISNKTKLGILPNWTEPIYKKQTIPRMENGKSDTRFRITFAGNIGTAQNFDLIVEIAYSLRSMPILWEIFGSGRYFENLNEKVTGLKMQNYFKLYGRVDPDELVQIYEHSDALLISLNKHPAFNVTVPGKFQSYLVFGKPILGFIDGATKTLINENQIGFAADPTKIADVKGIVVKLVQTTSLEREQMGDCARKLADREFERSKILESVKNYL